MSPFEWDGTLETGDPLVDKQHKAIVALFNELEAAADDRASIFRALDGLTEYALVHFDTEEDLMRRVWYPADRAEEHIAKHREVVETIRAFVVDLHEGRLESTAPLHEFLGDWLATHVDECDRELVIWARARHAFAKPPL